MEVAIIFSSLLWHTSKWFSNEKKWAHDLKKNDAVLINVWTLQYSIKRSIINVDFMMTLILSHEVLLFPPRSTSPKSKDLKIKREKDVKKEEEEETEKKKEKVLY